MTRWISLAARSVIWMPRPFFGASGVFGVVWSVVMGSLALGSRRLGGFLLLLVVRDRGLDRILGEHRAMDLDRGKRQLLDDLRVLDRHRLVDRAALEPLGGERRRRDR